MFKFACNYSKKGHMKNTVSILLIACFIFGCNQGSKPPDDRYGIDQLEAELKSGNKDLGYEGCAVLVYPIEFSMPDGTTLEMKKEEEVRKRLGAWYQNNPDSRQRPVMVFPVQMTFNGRTYTLNNDTELRRAREACNAKKRIFYKEYNEELSQILLDKGFEKEKIESIVGVMVRALDDARGKEENHQIDDRLKQYLVNDLSLTEDEVETIRLLIIRLANR